jgi:hypothetical protein
MAYFIRMRMKAPNFAYANGIRAITTPGVQNPAGGKFKCHDVIRCGSWLEYRRKNAPSFFSMKYTIRV